MPEDPHGSRHETGNETRATSCTALEDETRNERNEKCYKTGKRKERKNITGARARENYIGSLVSLILPDIHREGINTGRME